MGGTGDWTQVEPEGNPVFILDTIPRDVDDNGEGSADHNENPVHAPVPHGHVPNVWSPSFLHKADEVARLLLSNRYEVCGGDTPRAFDLGSSPDLIGVWLANEFYWGYRLEPDNYPRR
jgi:hypothetical protein